MPDFFTINRKVLILKANTALLDWYNKIGDTSKQVSEALKTDDLQLYLIPDFSEMDAAQTWLKENYLDFFETALEDWHEDDSYWPDDMSWEAFQAFFTISFQSNITDTVAEEDDEDDDDDDLFDGEGGFAADKDEMDWD